jgi:inhibitor of cysteine peptidase
MSEMQAPMVVRRGEAFTIEIPSAPTTGYRWEVTALPELFTLQHSSFRAPDDAQPGDGGVQVFEFIAVLAGSDAIGLACRRPWEVDAVEQKSVLVEVLSP